MDEMHAELELAQAYAERTLDPSAAAAFEDHLVGCERCQAEVKFLVGARKTARETPAARATRRSMRWAAAALLAAAIIAVVAWPRGIDPNIVALGQLRDAPAYAPASVRSSPRRGDSLFNTAMQAYLARRYDETMNGLQEALVAGVDTIPARFFMASAALMADNPRLAADVYSRVISAGPAAAGYLSDARFYRARALLRLGKATEALADLDAAGTAASAALADSVRQVLRR